MNQDEGEGWWVLLDLTYPFKPQYPNTNSPNWSPYNVIFLKNVLREFDERSRHFLFSDHFINSDKPISWQCMDIIRRKFIDIGHYVDLKGYTAM